MSTELAIIRTENLELIIKGAPLSYRENQLSHDRCLEFGRKTLNTIQTLGGMTDELDQEAALFIERAKNTVKKMNDKRAPVTKLFDEIRTVYTSMENDIDPSKPNSVPAQLQSLRNAYAAKKRAEAEAKRREEERLQRIEYAKNNYRIAVEDDYRQSFQRLLNSTFNEMNAAYNSVTLENYKERADSFKIFPRLLPETWIESIRSSAVIPVDLSTDLSASIRTEVKAEIAPKFREQYSFDIGDNLDNILFMLPSKKAELEVIAKSNKEEAERRRQEMARRESEETERAELERKRREEEERQALKMKDSQNELGSLFEKSARAMPSYQPKAQVKKKIAISSSLGFLDILNLWWTTEGCTLSIEELSKKFKSQITHCEKLANDKANPRFIQSAHIRYEDEVKAK